MAENAIPKSGIMLSTSYTDWVFSTVYTPPVHQETDLTHDSILDLALPLSYVTRGKLSSHHETSRVYLQLPSGRQVDRTKTVAQVLDSLDEHYELPQELSPIANGTAIPLGSTASTSGPDSRQIDRLSKL